MGAWGHGPFENDGAADLAWELRAADDDSGVHLIASVLNAAANTPEDAFFDSHLGGAAVAAAELVAAIMGEPSDRRAPMDQPRPDGWHRGSGEYAFEWVTRTQASADHALIDLALRALERVTQPMLELKDEDGQERWSASVNELADKLRA
jgi:hypothetical protein